MLGIIIKSKSNKMEMEMVENLKKLVKK